MTRRHEPPVQLDAAGPPVPPHLADDDIEAAVRVLTSGRLGGPDHPEVAGFEAALARWSRVRHAVAVNSGTAALHCALRAMGIGPGDEVIVPAHTFIATATSVLMAGATPVVVDVDPDTFCIDPDAVAAAAGIRTKAVIAVHLNGHPAPIDRLPTGLPVISDACQAHGASLNGKPVGALGAVAALSFWQDKLLTAGGEGGAVLTADDELADRVKLLRSHGQQLIGDGPHSHHVLLGFNYRLTAVQAAIAHAQLSRIDALLANRQARALQLSALLTEAPGLAVPTVRPGAGHVYWRYVLRLTAGRDRAELLRALSAEGVSAAPRYPIPLTRQPVLADSARILPCPVAEDLADLLIMLTPPATVEAVEELAKAIHRAASAVHA